MSKRDIDRANFDEITQNERDLGVYAESLPSEFPAGKGFLVTYATLGTVAGWFKFKVEAYNYVLQQGNPGVFLIDGESV